MNYWEKESAFEREWGKEVARFGFSQNPHLIIQNLVDFNIAYTTYIVMEYIRSWPTGRLITVAEISDRTGLSDHTIRNAFRELHARKLMYRNFGHGTANTFSFNGLNFAVKEYAKNVERTGHKLYIPLPNIYKKGGQNMSTNKDTNTKYLKEQQNNPQDDFGKSKYDEMRDKWMEDKGI